MQEVQRRTAVQGIKKALLRALDWFIMSGTGYLAVAHLVAFIVFVIFLGNWTPDATVATLGGSVLYGVMWGIGWTLRH